MPSLGCKETFLRIWEREFPVTVSVLRSLPDNALDFTQHERSRTLGSLAWQCLIDERVMASIAAKPLHDLRNVPPAPAPLNSIEEFVQAYEAAHWEAFRQVGALSTEKFGGKMPSIYGPSGDQPLPA
jgi:hypothetical protein